MSCYCPKWALKQNVLWRSKKTAINQPSQCHGGIIIWKIKFHINKRLYSLPTGPVRNKIEPSVTCIIKKWRLNMPSTMWFGFKCWDKALGDGLAYLYIRTCEWGKESWKASPRREDTHSSFPSHWKKSQSLLSLALAYLPELCNPPPPHPHSPISDLSSLILLLWSLADIFCHNPDAALLQSLLAFSWLLPWSAGCLFWTKPTLVCVWPLVSGIPTLLVTAGWLGTMKSLSVFRPHSPSPQGGRFSKTMEAFSISGTIWAARQEDGRTKRQRVRETS